MLGNASRFLEDLGDTSHLEERLSQSRIEPEFTMQAVFDETGIPPETLRSWESRHGFPTPVRNDSNRRLYSERDIISLAWLREQTALGQGISEAIEMLRGLSAATRSLSVAPSPAQATSTPSFQQPLLPVQTLTDALLAGNLEHAQSAWDRLAIATSADALCSEVLLPAHARLLKVNDSTLRTRLLSFMHRKVTVLFDQSSPDRGRRDIVILRAGADTTEVPAIALATILSRSGFCLPYPILDARDSGTVFALSGTQPKTPIILVAPGSDATLLGGLQRLLPETTCYGWWHDNADIPTDGHWLTESILDVPGALSITG